MSASGRLLPFLRGNYRAMARLANACRGPSCGAWQSQPCWSSC